MGGEELRDTQFFVAGSIVTFVVSIVVALFFYRRATADLRNAASDLKMQALIALRDLKEAADGLAKETRHIRQILVGNTPVTYPKDPKTGS